MENKVLNAIASLSKSKTSFTSFDIQELTQTLDIQYIDSVLLKLEHLNIIELEKKTINGKLYSLNKQ